METYHVCAKCEQEGVTKWGGTGGWLCRRHSRFVKMRHGAQGRQLFVPTIESLEAMVPANMICPPCGRTMVWHSSEKSRADVISLQHDHAGTVRLICQSCNVRHRDFGDVFFVASEQEKLKPADGMKRCSGCKAVKLLECFSKSKRSNDGLCNFCKPCAIAFTKAHREKNYTEIRAKAKAKYAANAEAVRQDRIEYRKANSEKLKQQARARYAANAERFAAEARARRVAAKLAKQ